jgi:hypothetical protein
MKKIIILILINNIFLINLFADESDDLIKKLAVIQNMRANKDATKKPTKAQTEVQKLKEKIKTQQVKKTLLNLEAEISKLSSNNFQSFINYTLQLVGWPETFTYNIEIISQIKIGNKRIIIVNQEEYNALVKEAMMQAAVNKKILRARDKIKILTKIKDRRYVERELKRFKSIQRPRVNTRYLDAKAFETKEITIIGKSKKISNRVTISANNNFLKIKVN